MERIEGTQSVRRAKTAGLTLIAALALTVATGFFATVPQSEAAPEVAPAAASTSPAAGCSLAYTVANNGTTPVVLSDGSSAWTATITRTSGCATMTAADLHFTPSDPAVQVSQVTQPSPDSWAVTLTSTTPGAFTLDVAFRTTSLGSRSIPFYASGPDPASSELSVSPTSATVPCDGTVAVVGSATIRNGDNIGLEGVRVTFTITTASGSQTVTRLTGAEGIATVSVPDAPALSEPMRISATIMHNGVATPVGDEVSVTLTSETNCTLLDLAVAPTVAGDVASDGISTYTATLTVTNKAGDPITGGAANVVFQGLHDGTAFTSFRTSTVTETAPGVYTATFSSTKAWTYQVTGHYYDTPSAPVDVTFAAPEPDPATSTLAVTATSLSIPCDGSALPQVTATATLRTTGGGVGADAPVTFTVNSGAPRVVTANSDGTATLTVTPSAASAGSTMTITATVEIDGRAVELPGSPATISLVPAEGCSPAPARWPTLTLTPGSQSVGMPITITAKPVDANGAAIPTLDPSKITFTPSSAAVQVSPTINKGNGEYTAFLTSATPGNYTLTMAYDGKPVNLSSPWTFSFHYGNLLVASPTEACVGDPVAVSLTLQDAESQPYSSIPVEFAADSDTATFAPASIETDEDGIASTTLTSSEAQTVVITAKYLSTSGVVDATTPVTVTFRACGNPEPAQQLVGFTLASGDGIADGTSTVIGALAVEDELGNPVEGLPAAAFTFASSPAGLTISTVTDSGGGKYTVRFSSPMPGAFTVTPALEGTPVPSLARTLTFVAPAGDDVTFTTPADGSTISSTLPVFGGRTNNPWVEVREGSTVLCRADGATNAAEHLSGVAWTCSPTIPLSLGRHTLTAAGPGGSSSITFTVAEVTNPTPTPTPTPTPSVTPTPTPTPSVTPTVTPTPTPSVTPTPTPSVTPTPTPSVTPTPTPSVTPTPSITPTPTPSVTPTPTPTPSPSVTPTPSPTPSPTPTPSDTPTTDQPTVTAPVDGATFPSPAGPVVVSGTAEPGAEITVTATPLLARARAVVTCSATADPTGNWSCTLPALAVGTHTLSITATIGQVTWTDTRTITQAGTTPPATPTPTPSPSGTVTPPASGGTAPTGGTTTSTGPWPGLISLAVGCLVVGTLLARRATARN